MAVIINGKVYVGGFYVGNTSSITNGVIDVEYDKQCVYVIEEV